MIQVREKATTPDVTLVKFSPFDITLHVLIDPDLGTFICLHYFGNWKEYISKVF